MKKLKRYIEILIILGSMIVILTGCSLSEKSNNVTENYSDYSEVLIALIACDIYLFWKIINIYKKSKKYKNSNLKECNAIITSFDGTERTFFREYYLGNQYSYMYTVDNKTYYRKNCLLKEVYNKGDKIKIIYNVDNIEDSITIEEYEKNSLKHRVEYIILFFICTMAIFLIFC